jgi:hypothetical protein
VGGHLDDDAGHGRLAEQVEADAALRLARDDEAHVVGVTRRHVVVVTRRRAMLRRRRRLEQRRAWVVRCRRLCVRDVVADVVVLLVDADFGDQRMNQIWKGSSCRRFLFIYSFLKI